MAQRHAFWVIVTGTSPTAFRSRYRDDLVPTLVQLQRTSPDAELKWFDRGKLWESPEAARDALKAERQQRRPQDREWRPGGTHKDPRARYQLTRDQKRARFKRRREGKPQDGPPPPDDFFGSGDRPAPPPRRPPRPDDHRRDRQFRGQSDGRTPGGVQGGQHDRWKKRPSQPRGENQPDRWRKPPQQFQSEGQPDRRKKRPPHPPGENQPDRWKKRPPQSQGDNRPDGWKKRSQQPTGRSGSQTDRWNKRPPQSRGESQPGRWKNRPPQSRGRGRKPPGGGRNR